MIIREPSKIQMQEGKTRTNRFKENAKRRRKRNSDDNPKRIKSLQQIIDEFRTTRDEIQSDFEWKYYNVTGLDITPSIQNDSTVTQYTPTTVTNEVIEISTQCACQLEIIVAVCSFGALVAIAYAIYKLTQFIRREK